MATLRNIAMGLHRITGQTNIAAATRKAASSHDKMIKILDHSQITLVTAAS